ncbi:hypothetical protein M446_3999 [Methylobacterium sp. 4-46]|uniref:glycosyltransferase n=1 Tax=unclassified Methylobacterium TaxID=2615210 RepID=UPI000152CABD|nr:MULTISPECIES: glycosyltransferase [Methylobacterium]ACA18363.1 hypothetical protein M446_3999 [Methylobacterium sp. 4-46]WFT77658.1 glycosyltransferase [Methylobacterium nodulans]
MTVPATSPNRFGQTVLFITPFASHPANSGQRRRVFQIASLLKRAGFRITFVLYAFELPWYWYFDQISYQEMVNTWGEVHIYPASKQVGLPPQDGNFHSLDEWWDPAFEKFLERLNEIKTFDVTVVTNVWMTKAFYSAFNSFKILDTLDVFSKRQQIANRTGIAPEFFWTDERNEMFGWSRADLVVTVTDEEKSYFGDKITVPVHNIPIVLAEAAAKKTRRSYIHDDRVVFGVLSSAQVYTVIGLNAVLQELELQVEEDFSPVDLIIGGTISDHVKTNLPVQRLGEVASEEEFLGRVDFIIAPQFDGTGFKVKVADAMLAGIPVLAAEHSSIGTGLPDSFVFSSPKTLARAMSRIALDRPPLSRFLDAVEAAAADLVAARERSEAELIASIERACGLLVLDVRGLSAEEHWPILASYVSWSRILSDRMRVFFLVDDNLKRIIGRLRNRWYEIVGEADLPDLKTSGKMVVALGPLRANDLSRSVRDGRWDWLLGEQVVSDPGDDAVSQLPFLHSDIDWLPGVMTMIRGRGDLAATDKAGERIAGPSVARVTVVENSELARALPRAGRSSDVIIALSDRGMFNNLIAELLCGGRDSGPELAWIGRAGAPAERLLHEIASRCSLKFTGSTICGRSSYDDVEKYARALLSGVAMPLERHPITLQSGAALDL